jgi:hypothetical protein
MIRIHACALSFLLLFLAQPRSIGAADGTGSSTLPKEGMQELWPENERKAMMFNAYAMGIGATLVPITAAVMMSSQPNQNETVIGTLVLGGMFIGPSVGQFYSRSIGQGFGGIGIRLGGALLSGIGIVMAFEDAYCDSDAGSCGDGSAGSAVFLLGGLTYAGGVVYSFVDTHAGVNRHFRNKEIEGHYGLAPVLVPNGDGSVRTGATAWMRF